MSKYIDSEKLIAELTRMQFDLNAAYRHPQSDSIVRAISLEYDDILSLVDSLQQEPRFPQYDNIIDKVFGAGNLEGFEYHEAEMLVALAKEELLKSLQQEQEDMGEVSDGYHTFNELYYYRMLYNAAFFNLLPKEWVHKSKRHHTGEECFGGGWFIVMANLPTGQVSNHYELKDWDLFKVPEKEIADEWDGHTPQEAADRLRKYLQQERPEVELERELRDYFSKWGYNIYNGAITMDNGIVVTLSSIQNVARHFYELGLKARKK